MNFTYGRYSVFQKIGSRLLSVRAGVGQYIMAIEVIFTPNNPSQGALVIDDLRVNVSFGNEKKYVGVARPSANSDGFITLRQLKTPQYEVQQQFELYLSSSTFEALEASRNGSDAMLYLMVSGNITGYAADKIEPNEKQPEIPWSEHILLNAEPSWIFKPVRGSHDVSLAVPQSDWVKLLDQAGYKKTVFFEIETPEVEVLRAAAGHIKDAQAAFLEGRYADAVAECRKAIESALAENGFWENGFCPWDETKNADTRKKMSVEDRFRLSLCAIRHITHSAHHSNGMNAKFERPMAQYVLGSTCLALSLMSKERELFVKPERSSPTG